MPSGEGRVVVPSARPTAVREIQLIDRHAEMQVLRESRALIWHTGDMAEARSWARVHLNSPRN